MPSEEDRVTTAGNMHKNSAKFGRAVFELYERTDRQTDVTILRTPPGGEAKTFNRAFSPYID